MFHSINRQANRSARSRRIRAKVSGTAIRPRLAIHRSLFHISAQLIDDTTAKTLGAVSDKGLTGTRVERARQVGEAVAKVALAANIKTVVFDRAGYLYHGRVAALAEGARQAGLQF